MRLRVLGLHQTTYGPCTWADCKALGPQAVSIQHVNAQLALLKQITPWPTLLAPCVWHVSPGLAVSQLLGVTRLSLLKAVQ